MYRKMMNPEHQQALDEHVSAIAKILYADAEAQGLPMGNLSEIEMTVCHQLQTQVSPQLGKFLSSLVGQKIATLRDISKVP